MTVMQEVAVEPMTTESFAPFGEVWDAADRPADRRTMSEIDFECDGRTTVHVIWQPTADFTFNELERHWGVTQGFVQLSGPPAVICVAAPSETDDPTDVPDPSAVRGFQIDPEMGFSYKRGTWHTLNRHILAPPGATFLILNSDPNPTQIVDYRTGTASIHRDLGADAAPEKIDLAGDFGVVFEIDA